MALATLSDVEAWLQLSVGNADEALLTRLIAAASAFVESVCSRSFALASHQEYRNGNGQNVITPSHAPIVAITTLSIGSIVVPATSPGGGSGYFVASKRIYLMGYAFTRGYANVFIDYTAGYATIPADISQAVIELVAARYKERDRVGLSSVHAGGETTSYSLRDMPAQVGTLLKQYQRVTPS